MLKYFYYICFLLIFSTKASAVEQKIIWAKTVASKTNTKFNLNYYSSLAPLKYKKNIIIASSSGHISSFNKSNGWRNWTKFIKKESFYFAKINKNILYLGSLSGKIFAFDLNKKIIIWKKNLLENSLYKAAIYKRQLLLLSDKGQLWSINKNNSQVLWSKKIFNTSLSYDQVDVKQKNKDDLFVNKNKLYIKHLSKIFYFNLRSKKIQWKIRYKNNIKQAKYFNKHTHVWIIKNRKRYLAGDVLKEKLFAYIYTQSNSLIKVLLTNKK
ncbi:MAG: PQQ-like beta-propeller repeat protein [Bdellovibrionales bacterium]|nr:PQQ-like beta-propeller repeat protein [Bdellovibrionales bacterium]